MIALPIPLMLIEDPERQIPVPSVFRYDSRDPYAVTIDLTPLPGAPPVTWILARDLLADGLLRPSGGGDVRIRRGSDDILAIELSSEEGEALLYAPPLSVSAFLALAYAAVPRGTETDHIDIGAELARMFGEAA